MRNISSVDIAKAVGFFLIFVAISVVAVTAFLVPAVRDYKKQNEIYKVEYGLYLKAKERHDGENERLVRLKAKNKEMVASMQRVITEQEVVNLAKNYFKKVDVKKINSDDKEEMFRHEDYSVNALFTSPQDLYHFLDSVGAQNAVANIKTPLVMADNGTDLTGGFVVRYYFLEPTSLARK